MNEKNQQPAPRRGRGRPHKGEQGAHGPNGDPQQPDPNALMRNAEHDASVRAIVARIRGLKAERSGITKQIGEQRRKLFELGHTADAVALLLKLDGMEPEHRDAFDLSLGHLRRAIDAPVQPDIFAATKPETATH